jgi:hypothetical protein
MSSGVSPEIIERYSVAFTRLAEPLVELSERSQVSNDALYRVRSFKSHSMRSASSPRSIGIAGLSKEEGAAAVFWSETAILRADLSILMLRPARS